MRRNTRKQSSDAVYAVTVRQFIEYFELSSNLVFEVHMTEFIISFAVSFLLLPVRKHRAEILAIDRGRKVRVFYDIGRTKLCEKSDA